MVISNLNHLETVSETKEIVGGFSYFSKNNSVSLTQAAVAVASGGGGGYGYGYGYGYPTGNVVANAQNSTFIVQH